MHDIKHYKRSIRIIYLHFNVTGIILTAIDNKGISARGKISLNIKIKMKEIYVNFLCCVFSMKAELTFHCHFISDFLGP